MSNMRTSHLASNLRCVLVAFSFAAPAMAIVARHDCPDAKLLELGANFPAVGQVVPDGGCTLIAPNWAVTAAHVAARVPAQGGKVKFEGAEYPVAAVVLHPDAKVTPGRPPDIDLALIKLERPVADIKPVGLYKHADELGKTGVIVGSGDVGDGRGPPKRSDGRLRAVTNVVDDAGPLRLFCKFDEPPGGTELEGAGGPGDSGGPLLIERDGTWLIAGVSSASMNGKPGRYGVTDVYTRVSIYAEWIEKTMSAHGQ